MRFKLSVFTIIGVSFILNACQTSNKAKIIGTIENAGTTELYITDDETMVKLDTVKVVDGKFTYEKELKEATPLFMLLKPTQENMAGENALMFAEKGNITLKAKAGELMKMTITGSKSHTEFSDYFKKAEPIIAKGGALRERLEANPNMTQEEVQKAIDTITKLEEENIMAFIGSHKSSAVSSFLAYTKVAESKDPIVIQKYLGLLEDKAKQTVYGQKVLATYKDASKVAIGQPAPDFILKDVTGKEVSLSSLQGKYVLIDFWASWCGPCRKENPNVVAAYNQFKDKGFTILGVSLDEDADKWKSAIEKDKLTWTQVSDLKGWGSDVSALYNVSSIPSNFLLDKTGKIIEMNLRGEALSAALLKYMP
jgi:peroxiredoxin